MSNIIVSPSGGLIEFNTGVAGGDTFFPSTAPIRLDATGGNSWITGSSVGIGTDDPSVTFHVNSQALDAVAQFESTDGWAELLLVDSATTQEQTLTRIGDNLTLLRNGGNVGIGTTVPAYPLHVYGAGRPAVFESSNGSNITKFGNSTCGVATYNGLDINVNAANSCGLQTYGMPMTFWTSTGNGIQGAERLRIDNDGNVGIGTTVPSGFLHVDTQAGEADTTNYGIFSYLKGGSNSTNIAAYFAAKDASVNYALKTAEGKVDFSGDITAAGIIEQRTAHSSTLGNIFVGDITAGYSAGQGGDIVFAGDPNGQGRASATFANIRGIKENSTYNNSLGALVFGTQTGSADFRALSSVTEKMRITSDGDVGIGTSAPDAKLHISGSDASSSTNSLLVENSAGVDMLWVDNGKNVHTRDNFYVHHETVSTRKLRLGWGLVAAHDAGNELTLASVYTDGDANKIFICGPNADNYPSDTIQVQANNGLSIYSGASPFPPEYHLHVSGDVGGTGIGDRITLNGTGYLLSGDSPAETQTLQDVCDNGSTTTTSISGVTGLFNDIIISEAGIIRGPNAEDRSYAQFDPWKTDFRYNDKSILQLSNGIVINNNAFDMDVQIHAVTANALFVEGSSANIGIGTGAPATTLDVNGITRIRSSSDSDDWIQWQGVHPDGRLKLRDNNDYNIIQLQTASNIQAFGEGEGSGQAGISDWAFMSRNSMATAAGLNIGSDNGTAGTHKSLGISTPQCNSIYGKGGPSDDYIQLDTYSIAGNTWAGERPAMRLGASGFDFYANTDTHGFADTPHFSINEGGYSYFSGKLGIGTTAPSYNLDFGTGAASTIRLVGEANGTAIRVGAGAAGGCDLTLLRVDGSSTQYSGVSDSGNYGFSLKYMGSRSSYDNGLSIFADNAEAAPIEALTIIQNGKVGIGSTSPANALDVVGHASISSSLTTPFVYAINGFGSNGNNLIYFNSASNYAKINTNGVERMRIDSAGDVGIGTDAPDAKLHISGSDDSENTNSFLVQNSGSVDMLWVDNDTNVHARDNLYVHHPTNSSRKIGLSWNGMYAYDANNELVLGSVYTDSDANKIYVCGPNADNYPSDTVQIQANNGLSIYSGNSPFPPEYHLHVSGDVGGTGIGDRITLNGTGYLLSGDVAGEADTLQTVTDRGATTTTNISGAEITGTVIIAPTGQFDIITTEAGNLKLGPVGSRIALYDNAGNAKGIYGANVGLGYQSNAVSATHVYLGAGIDSPDVKLTRDDASNVLALRNSTAAQQFNIYNTYSSSTNYERAELKWESDVFSIDTKAGSAGGDVLPLDLRTSGQSALYIDAGNQRVGIGTTVANKELHVVGDIWAYSSATDGDGDAYSVAGGSALDGNTRMAGLRFDRSNDVAKFGCYKNTSFIEEGYIAITSGGLVGIGTTAPTEALTVDGNIKIGYDKSIIGYGGTEHIRFYDTSDQLILSAGDSVRFDTKLRIYGNQTVLNNGGDYYWQFYENAYDGFAQSVRMGVPIIIDAGQTALVSRTNMEFRIDSDDNSTSSKFFVTRDTGEAGVDELFKIQENGIISGNGDFYGTGLEGRLTTNGTGYLLSGDVTTSSLGLGTAATKDVGISNNNVIQANNTLVDNDFLRIDGTQVEGRSASEVLSDIGGQASLTFGIANTNAVKIDSADVADDEYARFTSAGLESRSTSEVRSDIGLGEAATLDTGIAAGEVAVFTGSVVDNDFLRVDGTAIEGRSASEVLSDIGGVADGGSPTFASLYLQDTIFHDGDTDNRIDFGTDTISFATAGTTALTVASNSNVGVGTDSPNAAYKLHTQGLAYATGAVIGGSYAGQSPPTNGLAIEGKTAIGYYTTSNNLGIYGNASVGTSYITASAPSNGLIVQGNVGIGNNAPQTELDVSGAIKGGFSLSEKSADFTLGGGDNGSFINGTSASFDQITISSDLGAGFNASVMNTGANVEITGSSSMIINGIANGVVTLASGYQPASIVRLATNTYGVFGNLT